MTHENTYYRIREPWALRGWKGMLMNLWNNDTMKRVPLSYPQFELLNRCDGVTAAENINMETLIPFLKSNIVEASEAPKPLMSCQNYLHYPHRMVTTVQWSITSKCNMNCRHCFMASDVNARPCSFTLEEVRSTLEQFRECGIRDIELTGGEPLIYPHLYTAVDYMAEYGMRLTRLFTNGLLLNEDILENLKSRGMYPEIIISFDGLGVHDWLRSANGAEEAAVRAMRIVVERGLKLRCAVNLNRRSAPGAVNTARFLRDCGASTIFFIRTTEAPKWAAEKDFALTLTEYWESAVAVVEAFTKERWRNLRLKFFNGMDIPENAFDDRSFNLTRQCGELDLTSTAWCNKAETKIFVASDGRVLPCDAFEGATQFIGFMCDDVSIRSRQLSRILDDSQYAEFMDCTLGDVAREIEKCGSCEWFPLCKGGCRACGCALDIMENGGYGTTKTLSIKPSPISCAFFCGGYYNRMMDILNGQQGSCS